MPRKDKGTQRELTQLAERLANLAREVASAAGFRYGGKGLMAGEKAPISDTEIVIELKDIEYTIRGYDQRDRLTEDKT
jgi:hypothetical protein